VNHDEIVEGIIALLRQHSDGSRGTIHQEPYKGNFFRLFAVAFNTGLLERTAQREYLSADSLTDILTARSPEVVNSETFKNLHTFWQEWTHAWRRRSEALPVA
jgi:hypothetical protein